MKKGGFHAGAAVHDPAIFVDQDHNYYIFGSHMSAAASRDLKHWESFADGVNAENPLFDGLFDDPKPAFSYCGTYNDSNWYAVWAPDVSYNPYLGKYMMYFCTTASYMKSVICVAAADQPKGPYIFRDVLLYSGFDEKTVEETNLKAVLGDGMDAGRYLNKDGNYDNLNWPNCIDPNLFHDKDGRLWMVYGSWSGGIFVLEVDEKTGKLIHPKEDSENQVDAYYGAKLIGGGHKSIEGPYILYDAKADYYYLFVSFGWLERNGGYQIRVFRSKKPDGPYVDMNGKTFGHVDEHDPYGLKLMGNYTFPSLETGYKAPGHNSAFTDTDGKMYVVYHQRFDIEHEFHEPRVHQLFRTKSGWLTAAPFAADGETLVPKNYHESEICGTYYLVDHGLDISGDMHVPLKVEFTRAGDILRYKEQDPENSDTVKESEPIGWYTLEGESCISFEVEGISYEGVIFQQNDEAGNPTMCISGAGQNHSAWAVKYL